MCVCEDASREGELGEVGCVIIPLAGGPGDTIPPVLLLFYSVCLSNAKSHKHNHSLFFLFRFSQCWRSNSGPRAYMHTHM